MSILPGSGSNAVAINNNGDVIGTAQWPIKLGMAPRAVLWHAGVMQDISNRGQFSDAIAINDNGKVLLYGSTASEGVYLNDREQRVFQGAKQPRSDPWQRPGY